MSGESGTTTPPTDPPAIPPTDPEGSVRAEGRRAMRAARKQRRRISVGCAVLITVCVVITVLIVGLARDRASGPQVVAPEAALARSLQATPAGSVDPRLPAEKTSSIESQGAEAPQGGHR
jgi:hypothetical protein